MSHFSTTDRTIHSISHHDHDLTTTIAITITIILPLRAHVWINENTPTRLAAPDVDAHYFNAFRTIVTPFLLTKRSRAWEVARSSIICWMPSSNSTWVLITFNTAIFLISSAIFYVGFQWYKINKRWCKCQNEDTTQHLHPTKININHLPQLAWFSPTPLISLSLFPATWPSSSSLPPFHQVEEKMKESVERASQELMKVEKMDMKKPEMMEKKELDEMVEEMKKKVKSLGRVKVISVELVSIMQMKGNDLCWFSLN